MFEHPGVDLVQARLPDDDLHVAVAVQVGDGQGAELVAGGALGPAWFKVPIVVVDGDVAAPLGDDYLQVAIVIHVGDDDAGPYAAAGCVYAPL